MKKKLGNTIQRVYGKCKEKLLFFFSKFYITKNQMKYSNETKQKDIYLFKSIVRNESINSLQCKNLKILKSLFDIPVSNNDSSNCIYLF